MTDANSTIKVLQVNLNHCWAAQQLLAQTMYERETDVALISDFHHRLNDPQRWIQSLDGKCAVSVRSDSLARISETGAGMGYVWAKIGVTTLYSCYWTPNCPIEEFNQFLLDLETSIRGRNLLVEDIIVAGDFNSHSTEWGSASNDARGMVLSGFAASLDLQICNEGTTPTYNRVNASSVIDVTMARFAGSRRREIVDWEVLADLNSASDHEYVEFKVSAAVPPVLRNRVIQKGWSVKKLSKESLFEFWQETSPIDTLPAGTSAEDHSAFLQLILTKSCDAAMPRRTEFKGRRAAHWWNEEIADLRRTTISARRRYQRAGRRANLAERSEAFASYNQLRKDLRLAIRKSQEDSWKALCQEVDNDPWGVPYKLVTKRLGRRTPALDERTARTIATGLFPSLPRVDWAVKPVDVQFPTELESDIDTDRGPFTEQELLQAADRLPSGKAPGPDNVPNEIIKLAAHRFPNVFLAAYNACANTGHFPAIWKRARLVLIHKGQGKPYESPSSYRPISLLDGAGKLFERMLLHRLEKYSEGSLSPRQYGFRRGKSTTDAIKEVMKVAISANSGPVQNRDICAVVTIDVKNAFNSAPWNLIDDALQRSCAPPYLVKLLRSYMSDRVLKLDQQENSLDFPVMCGVPQGSVLGPTLWNLFYDNILKSPVPGNVRLVAFADDVSIVATAHTAALLEEAINPVLENINQWMTLNGLAMAPEKTECVILTSKHAYSSPQLSIEGITVPIKRSIRYLGVYLDTRMSFVAHAETVAAGARKAAVALGRLMPNVGGPSQAKRNLLMSVVHSRLLYGAAVWADSIGGVKKAEGSLQQAQRIAALRVARCYRTVSDVAALVLARIPPISLLAQERKRVG